MSQGIKKHIIYTIEELKKVLDEAREAQVFSFDIETSPLKKYILLPKAALDPHYSFVSTLSFAFKEDEGYVIPIAHNVGRNIDADPWPLLREIFTDSNVLKIAFNSKFEYTFLTGKECYFDNVADPLLMAVRCLQVTDPKRLDKFHVAKGLGLKSQSVDYLGHEMATFEDTLKGASGFADIDIEEGASYAIEDSVISLRLFYMWKERLEKVEIPELCNGRDIGPRPYKNYWEFLHNVECPVLRTTGFMQYHGISFDKETALARHEDALKNINEASEILSEIGKKYAVKVDPGKTGKTKSVRELLFDRLSCPKAGVSEKTGAPSLDSSSISSILHMLEYNLTSTKEIFSDDKYKDLVKRARAPHKNKEDLLTLIEAMNKIQKNGTLITAHIDGRLKYLNRESKRIHSNYDIWVETSRFSSSNPNAQNIPRKDNDEMLVRSMYQPEPGHFLMLVDYAAQEVRISAELYKDKLMTDIIKHGWDIHSFTAKAAFGLDVDLTDGSQVEKKYRTPAKPIIFTVTYGGGPKALQETYKDQGLYKSYDFCKNVIEMTKEGYPGIMEFSADVIKFAEKTGYVETMLGYKRYLKDINSSSEYSRFAAQRQAVNTPVQGTAADVTKMALNRLYNCYISGRLDPSEVKVIATIHDEIAFEIKKMPIEKIDSVVAIIKECMEAPICEGQNILHKAEPEIADPHDIYGIGYRNGWAEKYSFEKWRDKVICKESSNK